MKKGFTPLEKATDFNPVRSPAVRVATSNGVNQWWNIPYKTDGGLKPKARRTWFAFRLAKPPPVCVQRTGRSSITLRERSSLTGFTLLELLIGITIFAILASAVYISLYLGIKVSKLSENRDQLSQEAVMTLEQIAKKLRCAFLNVKNEDIKFIGTEKSLDFYCVNKEEELEKVTFYLEPVAEGGMTSLFQSKLKISGFEDDEKEHAVVELINSKISLFKISYFNGAEDRWEDEWDKDSQLPVQVKLDAGFAALSDGQPLLRLKKYVNIPAAIKIDFDEGERL